MGTTFCPHILSFLSFKTNENNNKRKRNDENDSLFIESWIFLEGGLAAEKRGERTHNVLGLLEGSITIYWRAQKTLALL